MSELINTRTAGTNFHRYLLTTVSALALLNSVNIHDAMAADEDSDRPTIWIELGGQLEHVDGQGEPFLPAFLAVNASSSIMTPTPPRQAQNPVPFEFGEEGRISFQPESSDWVFSAAARIGRSSNFKHVDHQTNRTHHSAIYSPPDITTIEKFADTQVHRRESHAILDFAVGKDVGLGLFGRDGSSTLNFGVRFAQFAAKEMFDVRARPDLHFKYVSFAPGVPVPLFHTYHATGSASRSFHGVGPSLSWNGSAPVIGNPQNGEMKFDWGANASILFGRQKARAQHQESAHYMNLKYRAQEVYHTVYVHPPAGHTTARSVTVPNVGGFAGISFQRGGAKVSLGYRADFFFGAMDGGIDKRKSENVGFYGPFATLSVGIGG
jgi:iron complex outermembrane receptor protein